LPSYGEHPRSQYLVPTIQQEKYLPPATLILYHLLRLPAQAG